MAEKRRLLERITDAGYVADLGDRSIDDLREMREECREAENQLSFERKLCHARIDILSAELDRRAGKGGGDLLERLPQILADESTPGTEGILPPRAPDYSIPRSADVPRRRVEEIVGESTLARLTKLSADEIKGIISSLADHEKEVSGRRKKVHEVLDLVQGEIVRRYASGEADPTAALAE